jgi:hypothetical protein
MTIAAGMPGIGGITAIGGGDAPGMAVLVASKR